MTATIETLLREGVEDEAWTEVELAVVRDGALVQHVKLGHGRVFDVASVTKVATAALALKLLDPARTVGWLPGTPTIRELLAHVTGLPAWRPLFALASPPVRETYRSLIAETPLDAPKPTYSDLGFLALGFELEDATGERLPTLARTHLFEPLGMVDTQWGGVREDAAPTGTLRPRPGNPRIESERLGEIVHRVDHAVDDDNAAALDGETGHAGMWSTALDVARLGDALRRASERDGVLPRERAAAMFEKVAGSRTVGLDTPSGDSPGIGTVLGRGPRGAAGHLGFTGCSLWIDRDARLSVALLSNSVMVMRPNPRLRTWRPRVHDAVAHALAVGLAP